MKKCIICWTTHTNSMSKCCSQKCENKHRANLNAKKRAETRINVRIQWVDEEYRESLREVVKTAVWPFLKTRQIQIKVSKGKTKSERQKLRKKADELWSLAVKINYWNKCAYSWESENLNSHHIESRAHNNTRWDVDNWICLTANHHTFSKEFSAHWTPAKFDKWIREVKWDDYINDNYKKSREVIRVTDKFIKEQIEKLEFFLKKNGY